MRRLAFLSGLAAAVAAGYLLYDLPRTASAASADATSLDLDSVEDVFREEMFLEYRRGEHPVVGLGDPELLQSQYETWKTVIERPYEVELSPAHPAYAGAGGWIEVDLDRERAIGEIHGIADEPVDLWFVDTRGSGAFPEANDPMLYVGSFAFEDGVAVLDADLAGLAQEDFMINTMVVTPLGATPTEASLLYGSPKLFQRLYALEERLAREAEGERRGMLQLATVMVQSGGVPTGFPDVFSDLVTQGEDLFFNETFDGNGRTCGTCHFAVNNFTIDVPLIASLPNDDPLFAAETQNPLVFGHPLNLDDEGNPRRFENPELMRAFGLIVENLDGTEDLDERFTMRGVPHNVGMRVSVTRPTGSIAFPEGPDERTGWSGDGSPFGRFSCYVDPGSISADHGIVVRGTTRSFALGAVIQHFPLTMDRSFCPPDPDFRLPNDAELDAFEAFFFALGRQVDVNLDDGQPDSLVLADTDADAGRVLFRDGIPPGSFTCNNCHTNAGANTGLSGQNFNFDTNVEEFLQNRLDNPDFTVLGEPRPIDGGFGLNPSGDFTELIAGPGNGNENFGDGTFNTVSLIEAADSAPFFHNNIAFTVEESIEFYDSEEFGMNFPRIPFDPTQVRQVAAFMRAVNALDNIENLAHPRAKKAIVALESSWTPPNRVVHFLLLVAIADTTDAIEVLKASSLHATGGPDVNAVKRLERARRRFGQAMNPNPPADVRIAHINRGIDELEAAVDIIRVSP